MLLVTARRQSLVAPQQRRPIREGRLCRFHRGAPRSVPNPDIAEVAPAAPRSDAAEDISSGVVEAASPDGDGSDSFPPSRQRRDSRPKISVPPVEDSEVVAGAELHGVVETVLQYGAFVNIGQPRAHLLHVSEVQSGFLADARTVLSRGQELKVRVVAVNEDGKVRLSLKPPVRTRAPKGSTAIRPDTGVPRRDFADLAVDQWLDGVVVSVQDFGAFVDIGVPRHGLLHRKGMEESGVQDAREKVKPGQAVRVRIQSLQQVVDEQQPRLSLSLTDRLAGNTPRPRADRGEVKYNIADLQHGQELEGTVMNVVPGLGAFVDIKAPRDALLHQSNWEGRLFSPGEHVTVWVKAVAAGQDRISVLPFPPGEEDAFSVSPGGPPAAGASPPGGPRGRAAGPAPRGRRAPTSPAEPLGLEVGQELEVSVESTRPYGVMCRVREGLSCLLHVNEMASQGGREPSPDQDFTVGQALKVRIVGVEERRRRVDVTQKTDEEREQDLVINSGQGFSTAVPQPGAGARGLAGGALAQALSRAGLQARSPQRAPPQQAPLQPTPPVNGVPAPDSPAPPSIKDVTEGGIVPPTITEEARAEVPAAPPAGAEDILTEAGAPTIPPSAPTPEPIDPAPVVEDVHHNLEPDVAAGTAPTNLDSGPAVPPVGANNLDGEVGAAPVPPAPTPEPIDPAQVVEDVHQNLEPDIAAGEGTAAAAPSPSPAPIDPAPLVEEVHEALEPDITQEPLTSLSPESPAGAPPSPGPTDASSVPPASLVLPGAASDPLETPPPAAEPFQAFAAPTAGDSGLGAAVAAEQGSAADPATARELLQKPDESPLVSEQQQTGDAQIRESALGALNLPSQQDPTSPDTAPPPANTATLEADGTVKEQFEEPVAKPSPALDLNGDNVPSVASPPISQAPQDTPELTKPLESVPQEPPSSIPSPTAVVEAEVGAPTAVPAPGDSAPAPAATTAGEPAAPPVPSEAPAPPLAQEAATASPPASSNGVSPSSTGAAPGFKVSAAQVQELRKSSGAGMMDCKKALTECQGDVALAADYLRKKGLAQAGKKAGRVAAEGVIASYIHAGNRLGVLLEVNCETDFVARSDRFRELVEDLSMQAAAFTDVLYVRAEEVAPEVAVRERAIEVNKEDLQSKPEKIRDQIVQGRVDKTIRSMCLMDAPFIKELSKSVDTVVKEAIAQIGENITIRRFERYTLGEGLAKKQEDLAAEVEKQTQALREKAEAAKAEPSSPKEELAEPSQAASTVQVSAKQVQELRQATGAGMMDCKKALAASEGDAGKAAEWLRKKGLASASKKAGRDTSEGALWSYIHTGDRLGVMVEVNCETDFVARSEKFLELCEDLSMQIAACDATVVSVEDISAEELERERQIELQRDDLASKPEKFRSQIVEGRVQKIAKDRALLEAAFVRDTNKTVRQHVQEVVAQLGENIQVRRFVRYNLGEGIEKKSTDFAAEVAAQTAGKA